MLLPSLTLLYFYFDRFSIHFIRNTASRIISVFFITCYRKKEKWTELLLTYLFCKCKYFWITQKTSSCSQERRAKHPRKHFKLKGIENGYCYKITIHRSHAWFWAEVWKESGSICSLKYGNEDINRFQYPERKTFHCKTYNLMFLDDVEVICK